jgi:hypothetical protein
VKYRDTWDVTTIPDDVLTAERNRRISLQRDDAPRAKVMRPCPWCRKSFGARDLRKHGPVCSKSPKAKKGQGRP